MQPITSQPLTNRQLTVDRQRKGVRKPLTDTVVAVATLGVELAHVGVNAASMFNRELMAFQDIRDIEHIDDYAQAQHDAKTNEHQRRMADIAMQLEYQNALNALNTAKGASNA
jgi:hypothetical protein